LFPFGAIGLEAEPYRSELARENIAVLNLTSIQSEDALNHGKLASSEVVALIGRRLAAGQTINDSHVGLGDKIVQTTAGAAVTIGTAAGLAVSAPVAIVDPQTRETFGEQIERLGRGVADTAGSTVGLATAPSRALLGR
jgi:esterase/lipase superfamily enzyme